jgi:hypothetical protein
LKDCIVEQKCKNTITGSTKQSKTILGTSDNEISLGTDARANPKIWVLRGNRRALSIHRWPIDRYWDCSLSIQEGAV